MGYLTKGWLLFELLIESARNDPDRPSSLVGMSPEETHTILEKVQDSDFKGLTELNLSCPMSLGNLRSPMILIRQIGSCLRSLPFHSKPLGIKLPPYLISFILIKQQRSLTNTRSSLSIAPIDRKWPHRGWIRGDPSENDSVDWWEYTSTALANVHAFTNVWTRIQWDRWCLDWSWCFWHILWG